MSKSEKERRFKRAGVLWKQGMGNGCAANVVKSFTKFIIMAWTGLAWAKHFSSAAPKRFSIFKYYISSWLAHRQSGKIITTYALLSDWVYVLARETDLWDLPLLFL